MGVPPQLDLGVLSRNVRGGYVILPDEATPDPVSQALRRAETARQHCMAGWDDNTFVRYEMRDANRTSAPERFRERLEAIRDLWALKPELLAEYREWWEQQKAQELLDAVRYVVDYLPEKWKADEFRREEEKAEQQVIAEFNPERQRRPRGFSLTPELKRMAYAAMRAHDDEAMKGRKVTDQATGLVFTAAGGGCSRMAWRHGSFVFKVCRNAKYYHKDKRASTCCQNMGEAKGIAHLRKSTKLKTIPHVEHIYDEEAGVCVNIMRYYPKARKRETDPLWGALKRLAWKRHSKDAEQAGVSDLHDQNVAYLGGGRYVFYDVGLADSHVNSQLAGLMNDVDTGFAQDNDWHDESEDAA